LAFARLFYHWDWPGAEAEIQRAVALNPGCPSAHLWNSFYLMAMNHPDEAIDEVRQAQALDPLSPPINASVGWELYLARRYDEAIEQCRAALELDPTFAWVHRALAWSYQEKAMFDEALAAFREASALSGSGLIDVAEWATACAVAGRTREAQKVLDNLKKQAAQAHVPAMYPALIYAALGDDDRAFEWLGTACDERSGRLVFLNVEPFWDRLRSDPRFTDLLHRVGLAEPVR
jgi:tetratricopeptide (TPR) repeat protein